MNGLYTKRHQLEALKEAAEKYPHLKIGASYMTLIKYEKSGIINPPGHLLTVNGKEWRFYTREEIDDNVKRVIAYKQQRVSAIK